MAEPEEILAALEALLPGKGPRAASGARRARRRRT